MYKDLSIIIPCKNEIENLKFIIPKLIQYSEDIIVVMEIQMMELKKYVRN